jgi:hypothetical protein
VINEQSMLWLSKPKEDHSLPDSFTSSVDGFIDGNHAVGKTGNQYS